MYMYTSCAHFPSRVDIFSCVIPHRATRANPTANRSEIATRIIRAATELNMESVAVYAFEDRNNPHRWCADQSFLLPASGTPVGAYLNIENLIKVAKDNGVDAIHPGYGFLSESAEFAQACADAGITFVGPRVEHLEIFGDKTKARELAINAGVSVVPGTDGAVTDLKDAEDFVDKYGLPVMIKAAKGGGGKGMRVVRERKDLSPFFKAAASEALASFGDGSCFIERYVGAANHIEVQVIGDGKGNVVHLWERDCSIQRRHQKLIEVCECNLFTTVFYSCNPCSNTIAFVLFQGPWLFSSFSSSPCWFLLICALFRSLLRGITR